MEVLTVEIRGNLYTRSTNLLSHEKIFTLRAPTRNMRSRWAHKSDTSFGLDLKTRSAHAGQQAPLSIQTESCVPVEKLVLIRRVGLALSVTVDALINTSAHKCRHDFCEKADRA